MMPEEIKSLLSGSGMTLCCAESCTAGLISHLITAVSGSSEYFLGGIVSYSPKVKEQLLGVRHETIINKGIVSSYVASEMAEGVKKLLNATLSVAITGWADALGDEKEPAGTAWVAVSGPFGTETIRIESHKGRSENIDSFAVKALELLKNYIQHIENFEHGK